MTPLQCEAFNVISIRYQDWTAESALKHMISVRQDQIDTSVRQVQEALKFLFESGKATRKRDVNDKRVWVYSAVIDEQVILDKPIGKMSYKFWAGLFVGLVLFGYIAGRMAG